MPRAVVRRRLADDLPERAAEGPQAGEADVDADVGDAAVGLAQQEHRALQPPRLQVTPVARSVLSSPLSSRARRSSSLRRRSASSARKATGHMAPSSRFAASLKPNIAYLSLNL